MLRDSLCDEIKYFSQISDYGQLGPVVIFVLGFIMIAVYWIILSPIVDMIIKIHNNFDPTIVPYSQERADAIFTLSTAYKGYLVFAVLVLVVWLLIQALREREGRVY